MICYPIGELPKKGSNNSLGSFCFLFMGFRPARQFGAETLSRAQMQPIGHPTQRQGRLTSHAGGQGQLSRIALATRLEFALAPTQSLEFLPDGPGILHS